MPIQPLSEGTELYSYQREGEKKSRFKIIDLAGSGTFGNTYVAEDRIFGDKCVIKEFGLSDLCVRNTQTNEITPHRTKKSQGLMKKWINRFDEEALHLHKIHHTNVVSVRLIWHALGTAFYAMDYIQGDPLLSPDQKEWKAKAWPEIEPIAFQILDGLEAVHDVELIHGDLKTENILLTKKGNPVLIDFGTARNLAEFQKTLHSNTHAYTPGYAPPELHGVTQTKDVGPWSDLHSWAMVVFGMLKKHPYTNGGPVDIVSRYRRNPDPYANIASLLPKIPSHVANVLQKCMQLDFQKRPSNVADVRNLFASKPMILSQPNDELTQTIALLRKEKRKAETNAANEIEKLKKALQQTKTTQTSSKNKLQREININQQETKTLQQELIEVRTDLRRSSAENSVFQNELEQAKKTIATQSSQNADLKKKTAQIQKKFTQTNDDFALLQQEIAQIRKVMQAKQALEQTLAQSVQTFQQIIAQTTQVKNTFTQATKAFEELEKQRRPKETKTEKVKIPKGFVLISAGSFQMGSPKTEASRDSDELLHEVKLTRSFYMQNTTVTQEQWRALIGNNPSHFKGNYLPVENVSWYEACACANALSRKEGLPEAYRLSGCSGKLGTFSFKCSEIQLIGDDPYSCKGYRLPTEAEWEYAARAGTKTIFYNGNNYSKLHEIAWFNKSYDSGTTNLVKTKQPNAWGLYDMSGNVWEWCWDRYEKNISSNRVEDPTGSRAGSYRVRRGGAYHNSARQLRLALRNYSSMTFRKKYIGFRLCRTVF